MTHKSPFIIVENFISASQATEIARNTHAHFNVGADGSLLPSVAPFNISGISPQLTTLVSEIEHRFNVQVLSISSPELNVYPANPSLQFARQPGCENSAYVRRKWVVVHPMIDLVGYMFLSDFKSEPPFDDSTHCYGGITEFPVYNFGIRPKAGTMVVLPAGPNFISLLSPVLLGNLKFVKFTFSVCTKDGMGWLYSPEQFGGDYTKWFEASSISK